MWSSGVHCVADLGDHQLPCSGAWAAQSPGLCGWAVAFYLGSRATVHVGRRQVCTSRAALSRGPNLGPRCPRPMDGPHRYSAGLSWKVGHGPWSRQGLGSPLALALTAASAGRAARPLCAPAFSMVQSEVGFTRGVCEVLPSRVCHMWAQFGRSVHWDATQRAVGAHTICRPLKQCEGRPGFMYIFVQLQVSKLWSRAENWACLVPRGWHLSWALSTQHLTGQMWL